MQQIEADPLPVISQKCGQEKEDEKSYYISPFPKRCKNGLTARYNIYYTTENNA